MTQPENRVSQWKIVVVAAAVITLFGLVAVVASADERADRLDRKIRVMEGIFNQVLVDSPNVVVSPGAGATRGLALDDYGVVFTIDGRLNAGTGWRQPFAFAFETGAEHAVALEAIEALEQRQLMGLEDDVRERQREERERERETRRLEAEERRRALEEQRRHIEARKQELEQQRQEVLAQQSELRTALVKELTDTLIDFGATLVELPDDATVTVAAFLDQNLLGFVGESEPDRVVISARMSDLRRFAGGTLDRPTMVSKITTRVTASD